MIHGGDIYRNKVKYDFSINVNSLGIPEEVQKAMREAVDCCSQYPDIHAEKLYRAIQEMTGVDQQNILCGNGASELFLAIVHAVKPCKILIPVPSFSGYEYAARAVGSEITFFTLKEEKGFALEPDFIKELDEGTDLLFLANPGNPTGSMTDKKLLEEILEHCMKKEAVVVVDECFLEFTGKEEICSLKKRITDYPNLIVVRAFTKIFAIPGVRLGYLFCANRELKKKIAGQLPEWNISTFAQAAGVKACEEKEYIDQTSSYTKKERDFLAEALKKEGIKVFPSETNYLLIHSVLPLFERLLEQGILIRDCSSFRGMPEGFYRMAVKSHEENMQLIKAIQVIKRRR